MGKKNLGKVRRKKKRFFSDLKFEKKVFLVSSASVLSVLTIFIFSVFFAVKTSDNRKYKSEAMTADSAASYMNDIIESAVSTTKTYFYSSNLYDFIDTDFSKKEYDQEYEKFIQSNGWLEMSNSLMKKSTVYTFNPTVENTGIINNFNDYNESNRSNDKYYWFNKFKSLNKKTAAFYDDFEKSVVIVRKLDNFPLERGEAYFKIVLNRELITKDLRQFSFDSALAVRNGTFVIFSDGVINEEDEYYSSHPKGSVAADFECISYSGEKGIKGFSEKNIFIIPLLICLVLSLFSVNYVMSEIRERIDYLHDKCTNDRNRISSITFGNGGRIISEKEKTGLGYSELLLQKYYSDEIKEQVGALSKIKFGRKIVFVSVSAVLSVLIIFGSCVYYIIKTTDKEKSAAEKMMTISAVCYLDNVIENISSISKSFYYSDKLYSFIDTNYNKEDFYSCYFDFKHNNDLLDIKNAFIKSLVIYTENTTINQDDLFAILGNDINGKFWYKKAKNLDKNIAAFYDGAEKEIVVVRKLDCFPLDSGNALLKITLNSDVIFNSLKFFDYDGEVQLKCSDAVIFSKGKDDGDTEGFAEMLKTDISSDFEFVSHAGSKISDSLINKFYFYIPLLVSLCISVSFILLVLLDIKKRLSVLNITSSSSFYSINTDFYAGKDEIGSVYKNLLKLKNYDETISKQLSEKENDDEGQNYSYEKILINAYKADACLKYMEVCRCAPDELEKNSELISLKDELKYTQNYLDDLSRSGREKFDYILAVDPSVNVEGTKIIPYGLAELAGYFSEYSGYGHDLVISVKEEMKYICIKFECKNISVNPSNILKFRAAFETSDEDVIPKFEVSGKNNPCNRLKNYYGNGVNIEIYSTEELDLEVFINKNDMGV